MRNTNDREGKMTMEPRKQFTFYRSYWEALAGLPGEDRLAVLDAVIPYALYGTPPGELSILATTAFLLIKPTLDSGRKKAQIAKTGNDVRWSGAITSCNRKKEKELEHEPEHEPEQEPEHENESFICNTPSVANDSSSDDEESEGIRFPLKDGSYFTVTLRYAKKLAEEYPMLEIVEELESMRRWLECNPMKRKTRRGIHRFINGWLNRSREAYLNRYTHGADRLAQMIQRGDFDEP